MPRTCPNEADHTPSPSGYMEWHDWADRMAKTHKQETCPGCGRWEIWTPKDPDARSGMTERNHA